MPAGDSSAAIWLNAGSPFAVTKSSLRTESVVTDHLQFCAWGFSSFWVREPDALSNGASEVRVNGWSKVHSCNQTERQNMPANPGTNEKFLKDAIKAWRSLKPGKKFLALTVDGFEAELKPCFDARAEISDLENKLTGARNRRNDVDVEGLALVARLVSAIKSDEAEGEDSELLDAMGYVIPSKRKSGLHRNVPPSAEPFPKAA